MKRALKVTSFLLLVVLLLRGPLFRLLVKYEAVGVRSGIALQDESLQRQVDSLSAGRDLNIKQVARLSSQIVTNRLSFTTEQAPSDPNRLYHTRKGNCVGYAAMFHAIADYLIRQQGLEGKVRSRHLVGRLRLLGIDLHQFFDSPFYQDHDYNELTNLLTGERLCFDAVVADYFGVRGVAAFEVD
jgi:hypothetical protein